MYIAVQHFYTYWIFNLGNVDIYMVRAMGIFFLCVDFWKHINMKQSIKAI